MQHFNASLENALHCTETNISTQTDTRTNRRVETFCMGAGLSGFQASCTDLPQSSCREFHCCCRRFCVINWFFWGSSGFISFQSPCTSSSHVCTCFLLSAAANCASQMTIDPIRSRTYTFEMLYLYLLIKSAKASLENYGSAGFILNVIWISSYLATTRYKYSAVQCRWD